MLTEAQIKSAIAYNTVQATNLQALRALGWWPWEHNPTTAEGVQEIAAWQAEQKLGADGKVGPGTWARLRAVYRPAWGSVPHGLAEILARYGDPRPVKTRKAWARASLTTAVVLGRTIGNVHKAIVAEFTELLDVAAALSGYTPRSVQTWNVRQKRGGDRPAGAPASWSTHSWAVAFDADPKRNPWGNKATSPVVRFPLFAAVFRVAGWSCGTDWNTPDTMHFQGVRGY